MAVFIRDYEPNSICLTSETQDSEGKTVHFHFVYGKSKRFYLKNMEIIIINEVC